MAPGSEVLLDLCGPLGPRKRGLKPLAIGALWPLGLDLIIHDNGPAGP